MSVLFQSFFPISLRASHIAKVALRARILVNYTSKKRFRETVLILEVRRNSVGSFEYYFYIAER